MTPDERLREAVLHFIIAQQEHDLARCAKTGIARDRAYRDLLDEYRSLSPRPCVNASEVIEKDRSWFGWFQRWRKKS